MGRHCPLFDVSGVQMMGWFCSQCFEDQEGSVWGGFDKETGKTICLKCQNGNLKETPHNAGPEHYCPTCKLKALWAPGSPKNDMANDDNSAE